MTRVVAPEKFTGAGVGGLEFVDGVADTDNEAILAYCRGAGYQVGGEAGVRPLDESEISEARRRGIIDGDASAYDTADVRRLLDEPPDPRDVGVVSTTLRDAAVDPRPEDFLPPTNAGAANPHGPLVVAPGIHAVTHQVVRPGVVHVDDPKVQEEAETQLATDLYVDGKDVGDAVPTFERDGSDTGPLGLSDPGSVDEGVRAAAEVAAASPERPAKSAPKAEWVAYAVSQGMAEVDADAATKADLVDRFGG